MEFLHIVDLRVSYLLATMVGGGAVEHAFFDHLREHYTYDSYFNLGELLWTSLPS